MLIVITRTGGVRGLNFKCCRFFAAKGNANCDWLNELRRPITVGVAFCGKNNTATFKIQQSIVKIYFEKKRRYFIAQQQGAKMLSFMEIKETQNTKNPPFSAVLE